MQEENKKTNSQIITGPKKLLSNDFLIPISIILAGIFIGAGMYFNGLSPKTEPTAAVAVEPAKGTDKTSKVNPVTADDHIKGSINAPIKIVEFSDFDCPFCSRHHGVMTAIAEKYSGDEVAMVFRQFPLEQLHPQSPAVAMASECVAEIGGNDAFWKFADAYFSARASGDKTKPDELIPRLVTSAGVGKQEFTECFESGRQNASVQEDMDDAIETGGQGTPWNIIIGPTGKTYPINGAQPQQVIEQLIEKAKQEA